MGRGRILVVEDNELTLELVREVLEGQGYEVHQATRALDGISLAKLLKPDLILMDVQLPGLDGLSAVRCLREDPATGSIPVVAFTAHAMEADRVKAREAGCVGHIAKPIQREAFLLAISGFIGTSREMIP